MVTAVTKLKTRIGRKAELTHWKRLWCWERLKEGGEGDDRGWDGLMASLTQWTWVWVNSGSWCWTGKPGVLRFTGLQRFGHDWATELNWISENMFKLRSLCFHFISDKRTISWIWASENDNVLQKGTTAVWCHDLIKDGSIHWPVYSILSPRRLQSPKITVSIITLYPSFFFIL